MLRGRLSLWFILETCKQISFSWAPNFWKIDKTVAFPASSQMSSVGAKSCRKNETKQLLQKMFVMCSMWFDMCTPLCFLLTKKKHDIEKHHWSSSIIQIAWYENILFKDFMTDFVPQKMKMYLTIDLLQEMGNEDEEEDLDKETVGRKVGNTFLKTFKHWGGRRRKHWYLETFKN